MKELLYVIFFTFYFSLSTSAQDKGWEIKTEQRTNYHPIALANGMIGIVPSESPLKIKEVILNGVWDIYGRGDVSNIVQGINFLNLDIQIDDDDNSIQKISNWQQELDLKEASLTTSFVQNKKIKVENELLALRHLAYSGMSKVKITALEDVKIKVSNEILVPEVNQEGKGMFHQYGKEKEVNLHSLSAFSPTGKYCLAATSSFIFDHNFKPSFEYNLINAKQSNLSFEKFLQKGEVFEFVLVGSICNTAQSVDAINEAERKAIYAHLEGYERLHKRHLSAWESLWESDIIIDGDLEAQLDVRLQLFNLYSFQREGTRLSISPVGLSGNGYNGHIFWDTELWMFPTYLLFQPALAKNILDYRIDRLDQAKKNAFMNGYKGVMFPWESALSGEEDTPTWALTGPFEQHITSCIGLAFWKYYQVTQDKDWLANSGYEVLSNIADFWVSRVEKDTEGVCHINNVVCADEYAENVNDNAFTNASAIKVLKATIKASKILGKPIKEEWVYVSENIPVIHQNGITMEYEGYDGRTIKQVDVNLLSFPLQYFEDQEQIKRNLDFYEPKIAYNAPAMSHSILSVIASRLGDTERAYQLFQRGYKPNQKPPFNAFSEQPDNDLTYFVTGSGGMLQAMLFGFGGMEITDQGIIQIESNLPLKWKKLILKGVGKEKKTYTIIQKTK